MTWRSQQHDALVGLSSQQYRSVSRVASTSGAFKPGRKDKKTWLAQLTL